MNTSKQNHPKPSRPGFRLPGDRNGQKMLFLLVILQLFLWPLSASRALAGNGHSSPAKHPPVIIFQEHQDVGPAILPNGSGTRIEYRKILFRGQGAGNSPRFAGGSRASFWS